MHIFILIKNIFVITFIKIKHFSLFDKIFIFV